MATSGTRTFILTRDNIIEEAFRLIGVLGLGDSASAAMKTEAQQTMNIMVNDWQNDGIHLWEQSIDNAAMVSATASYTLDVDTLEAKDFIYRDTAGEDKRLTLIDRAGYMALTDKDEAGEPTRVFVDYQLAAPVAYLHPIKATCTTEALYFTKIARLQDFSATGDNPDFPTRWYKALVYNLAADLAPVWGKLGLADYNTIVAMAAGLRMRAKAGNPRSGNMRLVPRMR